MPEYDGNLEAEVVSMQPFIDNLKKLKKLIPGRDNIFYEFGQFLASLFKPEESFTNGTYVGGRVVHALKIVRGYQPHMKNPLREKLSRYSKEQHQGLIPQIITILDTCLDYSPFEFQKEAAETVYPHMDPY